MKHTRRVVSAAARISPCERGGQVDFARVDCVDSTLAEPCACTEWQALVKEDGQHLRRVVQNLNLVVEVRGRKGERLLEVALFEVGAIGEQFSSLLVGCEDFQNPPYGDPEAADTRLAAHFTGLDRNAVEWWPERHTFILSPGPFTVKNISAAPPLGDDARRLVPDPLHVLDIRARVNQRLPIGPALAAEFQNARP